HQPGGDAVKVAQLSLETCEDRQRSRTGRLLSGLQRHLGWDLAERAGERAIRRLRAVAGDVDMIAAHAGPREGDLDAPRRRGRLGKHEPEGLEPRFNLHRAVTPR